MTLTDTFRSFLAWGPDATGSTRAVGLVRIGLSTLALIRFAAELAPFAAVSAFDLVFGLAFLLIATCALIGRSARLSIGMLGAMILTLYGLKQNGIGLDGWNHHHVYILGVSCILLSLTECGRSYSYDRWRALQRGDALPETGALWGQRLITLQMSALYFWTAVDKTVPAFLSGQRLEQIFVWSYSGRALEVLLAVPALLALMSIAVVVVEYILAFAIFSRRWLRFVVPLGLSLHAAFFVMLPVETYSATMMILYLLLLDPKSVQQVTQRMHTP